MVKIRTDPLDFDFSAGFTATTDVFRRESLARSLTRLFIDLEQGCVCLLDGRWGSGKSTFIKQWIHLLNQEGVPSVYFDAFQHDYIEVPYEAVAGALVGALADANKTGEPAYRTFLDRAAKVGRAVAGTTAKVGIKAATFGVIGQSELSALADLKDDISSILADASESAVKSALESYSKNTKSFSALKESLDLLPALLASEVNPPCFQDSPAPLIFFIDELDRCRPDFALGLLETLKHFFRSNNIHFVLVTNSDHLLQSVAHRYGQNVAAAEYLQKFYDFVVHFDIPYNERDYRQVDNFIANVLQRLLPEGAPDANDIAENIAVVSRAYGLSLRQIEALCTNIALSLIGATSGEYRPPVLVTILCAMKGARPDLYRLARNGSLTIENIEEFISVARWTDQQDTHITRIFRFYLDPDLNPNTEEWRGFGNSTFRYNISRLGTIQYLCNGVIDRFAR